MIGARILNSPLHWYAPRHRPLRLDKG